MKQAQINQIESIAKKSWLEIFKLFAIVFFLKNPIIYFPLYPRINPKNALIQIITSRINLGCFAIAFRSIFYIDFFRTWSNSIGCFLSIRYKGKVIHKRYFMPKKYQFIYKAINNQNGYITIESIVKLYKSTLIVLFLAFTYSFADINMDFEIRSLTEVFNTFKNAYHILLTALK